MRNNTDKPMYDPDYPDHPLQPGHVRLYEFLHGFEDITLEEEARRIVDWANDPLAQLLDAEMLKEINKQIIAKINEGVKE